MFKLSNGTGTSGLLSALGEGRYINLNHGRLPSGQPADFLLILLQFQFISLIKFYFHHFIFNFKFKVHSKGYGIQNVLQGLVYK
jgi:hypothetical protein